MTGITVEDVAGVAVEVVTGITVEVVTGVAVEVVTGVTVDDVMGVAIETVEEVTAEIAAGSGGRDGCSCNRCSCWRVLQSRRPRKEPRGNQVR